MDEDSGSRSPLSQIGRTEWLSWRIVGLFRDAELPDSLSDVRAQAEKNLGLTQLSAVICSGVNHTLPIKAPLLTLCKFLDKSPKCPIINVKGWFQIFLDGVFSPKKKSILSYLGD